MKGTRSYSGEQCKQKNDTKWAANVVTLGEVVASDWREFRISFLIIFASTNDESFESYPCLISFITHLQIVCVKARKFVRYRSSSKHN